MLAALGCAGSQAHIKRVLTPIAETDPTAAVFANCRELVCTAAVEVPSCQFTLEPRDLVSNVEGERIKCWRDGQDVACESRRTAAGADTVLRFRCGGEPLVCDVIGKDARLVSTLPAPGDSSSPARLCHPVPPPEAPASLTGGDRA